MLTFPDLLNATDKPVDVGWGSKATQFHGSEGKAAAEAAAELAAQQSVAAGKQRDTRGPHVIDDDGRPRISWKADSAVFAVSSLESSPIASTLQSGTEDDPLRWNRVIRVYSRLGILSSTSDASIRGVSQALAYKPVGNLIATTQRFGPWTQSGSEVHNGVQWAQGRHGRHDVIFYERNGLRHGEFSLREDAQAQPKGVAFDAAEDKKDQALAMPVLEWQRLHRIRELAWNADGSALAVLLERGALLDASASADMEGPVLQIWTTGNYHWYLKQEIRLQHLAGLPHAVVRWHPERATELCIADATHALRYTFAYETSTTIDAPPLDASCAAVADGAAALLTPFRLQNVPPPMCTTTLVATARLLSSRPRPSVPIHYAWASVPPLAEEPHHASHVLAMLYDDSTVELVLFDWGTMGRRAPVGGRPVPVPQRLGRLTLSSQAAPLQVAVCCSRGAPSQLQATVRVLGVSQSNRAVVETATWPQSSAAGAAYQSASSVSRVRIKSDGARDSCILLEEARGTSRPIARRLVSNSEEPIESTPTFCSDLAILSDDAGSPSLLGLSSNGRLYAGSRQLASGVNSFTLAGNFLVWTTTQHQAKFLPLDSLRIGAEATVGETVELSRTVERGSRIVTAVPSEMALVLQMPRGNLETVNPRPLVLEVVKRDLTKKRYRSALRVCRSHRLDLNLLHDFGPAEFMDDVALFVKQVADVDHLNLFLTSLRDEDVTKTLYKEYRSKTSNEDAEGADSTGKVNRICSAMRAELEREGGNKYLQTQLTSYVRETPPDYEGALSLLRNLEEDNSSVLDEAVKYIVFLADAELLYDVALGMYDFTLALMLAQHAPRKDPREYLPFLRELRAIESTPLQRYRIDDHLTRYPKAFRWLAQAGDQHADDAFSYMCKHDLYEEGFVAFDRDTARLRKCYKLYGDWMLSRTKPADAAVGKSDSDTSIQPARLTRAYSSAAYTMAHESSLAVRAYQSAGLWQDALAAAIAARLPGQEIAELAKTIVDDLETSNKPAEAAQVALAHLRDVESAVTFYCKANDLSQAKRVCALYGRADLVETHVKPLALDCQSTLLESLGEMQEQLDKQVKRLVELLSTEKITAESMAFAEGGEGGAIDDNIDVMSDTSTQITQFTRYTAALTAISSVSSSHRSRDTNWKQSKQKRKKEMKKKESGKKGSVYEENYLFESLQRLVKERLTEAQGEGTDC